MTPQQQIAAVQRIGLAVLETIAESGSTGAPGGVIYAALQAQGATYSQFESLMSGMVKTGMVTLEDDCYQITEPGRVFINKLKAKFAGTTVNQAMAA